MRKPEKRIRKLGRKKDISWFQRKLDCEMWPCLTFCWIMIGLAVKRWLITFYQFFRGHVTRTVLCAIQTTPPTACQGKGRTGSTWNIDCFDFKGKRTLLNCCWFKLIHVWFCDAVKVRSGETYCVVVLHLNPPRPPPGFNRLDYLQRRPL